MFKTCHLFHDVLPLFLGPNEMRAWRFSFQAVYRRDHVRNGMNGRFRRCRRNCSSFPFLLYCMYVFPERGKTDGPYSIGNLYCAHVYEILVRDEKHVMRQRLLNMVIMPGLYQRSATALNCLIRLMYGRSRKLVNLCINHDKMESSDIGRIRWDCVCLIVLVD